jgi:hypothetical protein
LSDGPATRRSPLVAVGVLLIVVAAVLVALVTRPRPAVHIDAPKEAGAACRNFEDVYGATKPGTPFDGQALASRLEQAIGQIHKAASADARYKPLASTLDSLGSSVNADDAPSAYAEMQDAHNRCTAILNPSGGSV